MSSYARKILRDHLKAEPAALEVQTRVTTLDLPRIALELRHRLTDWQGLLGRHPDEARLILDRRLGGRLVCTPKQDTNG
jgi:hypothetical protein